MKKIKSLTGTGLLLALLSVPVYSYPGNDAGGTDYVREDTEAGIRVSVQAYLSGLKVVADQLSEDADNQAGLLQKTRDKTEAVKLYNAYTRACIDYAEVLNDFYKRIAANPFLSRTLSLEESLKQAIAAGKIIQKLSHIEIPEMFKYYIEAREVQLREA